MCVNAARVPSGIPGSSIGGLREVWMDEAATTTELRVLQQAASSTEPDVVLTTGTVKCDYNVTTF